MHGGQRCEHTNAPRATRAPPRISASPICKVVSMCSGLAVDRRAGAAGQRDGRAPRCGWPHPEPRGTAALRWRAPRCRLQPRAAVPQACKPLLPARAPQARPPPTAKSTTVPNERPFCRRSAVSCCQEDVSSASSKAAAASVRQRDGGKALANDCRQPPEPSRQPCATAPWALPPLPVAIR